MLCHSHHKEADSFNTNSPNSKEYRQRLLRYTLKRAVHMNWQYSDTDKQFLEEVSEDVQDILNGI